MSDSLTALLTADAAWKRSSGRLVASGAPETIERWMRSELARGVDVTDVLQALMSTLAWHVARTIAEGTDNVPGDGLTEALGTEFEEATDRALTKIRAVQRAGGPAAARRRP